VTSQGNSSTTPTSKAQKNSGEMINSVYKLRILYI